VAPNLLARSTRLFSLLAAVAAFVAFVFSPTPADAHEVPPVPAAAGVTSAVVRIDAYEHESRGAVVGDGHLVLVPFAAIEVARPGGPHAIVTDAKGIRHDAEIVATERYAGLALLAVEAVLTATPFAMSPSKISDVVDTFAIPRTTTSGAIDDDIWAFYPGGLLAGAGEAQISSHLIRVPDRPADGSPVIDVQGRLVALRGISGLLTPKMIDLSRGLARLDGSTRARRPVIFYGGVSLPVSFARDGGGWVGMTVSFGARIHDIVELRLDHELSLLLPTGPTSPSYDERCTNGNGRCSAGLRGVLTPSVGYRLVVGGIGGARAWPIALTPSIGYALGLQRTHRENGAPAYDVDTPATWAQPAPGVALSISMVELRGRVRIPIDREASPTIELGIGSYF
jgi:hypothetical protein